MIHIYPKVQTLQTQDTIVFRTKLIKEANGKYYYWNFYKKELVDDIEDRVNAVNRFHADIYNTIILGRVDLELKLSDGTPLFELAYEQISEEQRLRNYLDIFNKPACIQTGLECGFPCHSDCPLYEKQKLR